MLPGAECQNTDPFYIGNPLSPRIDQYGFIDYERDFGRVTDGLIKGPNCDCEAVRTDYIGDSGIVEQYNTFPI